MLNPREAKERLAAWQLPEEPNRIAAGVKKLPAKLRSLVDIICGLERDAKLADLGWRERQRRRREAAIRLDRLPASERARFFRLFSPHLISAMEASWQLLKTTPYQIGYFRKAFRAAGNNNVVAERRCQMIDGLAFAARYPADMLTPTWLAAWAPHLVAAAPSPYMCTFDSEVGVLLAAVLRSKSPEAEEVFEILRQSLTNQHEIGGMGRHVVRALLLADRPEGWELIEKTLLAAQRQEGLRQVILEGIDEAHPEAFRRMLRLILDHDLVRFSATVRAVDVWFGNLWAAASTGIVKKMLAQVVEYLEDASARDRALTSKDPQTVFLALWCLATEDALASVPPARTLLDSSSVELRYVAARHLANLGLGEALSALTDAIDDTDLRVALLALGDGNNEPDVADMLGQDQQRRFDKIVRLLERMPAKPQKLKALVWPWTESHATRAAVASALVGARGTRPATILIPHLDKMDSNHRYRAASLIIEEQPADAATRQMVLDMVGSTSESLRRVAFEALGKWKPRPGEPELLESHLARKAGDLRTGVLGLLLKQKDASCLASGARLLASSNANQRLAGLELLRLMSDAKRGVAPCRQQAEAYRAGRKRLTREEQAQLAEIAHDKAEVATLDNALGLIDPVERSPVVPPRNLKTNFITEAAVACVKSLDDLVHAHRETTIRYESYAGPKEELLGNLPWGFPGPDFDKPRAGQVPRLPLAEVWTEWFHQRGKQLRDADGWELVRALAWSEVDDKKDELLRDLWPSSQSAAKSKAKVLSGWRRPPKLRYPEVVKDVLQWLLFLNPVDARDYLLDATETAYSLVPATDMKRLASLESPQKRLARLALRDEDDDWRDQEAFTLWPETLEQIKRICGEQLNGEQRLRHWRLLHWLDEPFAGAARRRPDSDVLLDAYDRGAATLADIGDQLLGPRGSGRYGGEDFDLLYAWTQRKLEKKHDAFLAKHSEARDLLDRAVARVIDLELARGDAPTAVSGAAHAIRALFGTPTLLRVVRTLGKADFKHNTWRSGESQDRRQALTHLARVTYPAPQEEAADVAKQMRAAVNASDFPEERLLQLTFLAPQWTKFVAAYFGWEHFDEGVYWFLAHMRSVGGAAGNAALGEEEADDDEAAGIEQGADADGAESADGADGESNGEAAPPQRKLSAWERLVLERTPLTDDERGAGAIDVEWFRRTHRQLGPKRWEALACAARFAANASQAKRAQFIADVLLNKVKRRELIAGIKTKQLKEHVRLLGLLPLANGKTRDADLAERWRALRDYRRYANSLSGLTKSLSQN